MAQQKATCPRCGGKGVIPQYFYNRKGICFLCWGSGHIMVTVPSGKDKDTYIKELQKEEAERFKKHPPKVAMPDKKDQRNKEYFKGAKPGVPDPEGDEKPKPDAKPNAKPGSGKPDAKPAPKPQGSEAQKGEAVKQRNDKRKEHLAALGIDTSKNGGDTFNAVAAKYKTDGRFRANFKVLEMAKAINEKDKKDGFRSSDLITEAYVMAKLGEAVGKAEGLSAANREALKQIPPEKREDLKKTLQENMTKFNGQASNIIAGIIKTGDSDSLDALGVALKATVSAAKMLQEVDAIPYEGEAKKKRFADRHEAKRYMEEKVAAAGKDLTKLKAVLKELESEELSEYRAADRLAIEVSIKIVDQEQYVVNDYLSKSGFNRKSSSERTIEDYEKVIKGLEAMEGNDAAKRAIDSFKATQQRLKNQKQVQDYREKYGVEDFPTDLDLLAKARKGLEDIEDPLYRESESKRLAVIEKKAEERKDEMELLKKAVTMNRELEAKRQAAADNKHFADTEIGRKIKGMVGDGVKDDSHAREIGKVAAAEFEKNITKFSEVSWEEFAKTNKELREKVAELQAASNELAELQRVKQDVDRTHEWDAADARMKELRQTLLTLSGEITAVRTKVHEQQEHITEAKQKAYLTTLTNIRDSGFDESMNWNKEAGNFKPRVARYVEQQIMYFPKSWVDVSNQNDIAFEYNLKRAFHRGETKPRVILRGGKPEIYSNPATLAVSGQHPKRTIVHELGHRMETTNPNISKVLRSYYNRVTKGQGETWLGGSYGKNETYRKRKDGTEWVNTYMGKDYDERAWELLTMGLEAIIFDQHHSRTKRLDFDDRETYETIWGVIAGA